MKIIYDQRNLQVQRTFADTQGPTDKVVFTYDAASRITQAVSNRYQNTVTRSYNDDATIASEGLTTNGHNYCKPGHHRFNR